MISYVLLLRFLLSISGRLWTFINSARNIHSWSFLIYIRGAVAAITLPKSEVAYIHVFSWLLPVVRRSTALMLTIFYLLLKAAFSLYLIIDPRGCNDLLVFIGRCPI